MRGLVLTTIVIAAVCGTMILVAGCEPEPASSAKQERLFAAENMELKKQIVDMEKRHEKELVAKQKLLNQCEQEKQVFQTQADEQTIKMFEESVTTQLMEQLADLLEENKQLKAQLESLTK